MKKLILVFLFLYPNFLLADAKQKEAKIAEQNLQDVNFVLLSLFIFFGLNFFHFIFFFWGGVGMDYVFISICLYYNLSFLHFVFITIIYNVSLLQLCTI